MSRPLFALVVVAVIAIAFLGMWLGWRARARRDAGVHGAAKAPAGALIAEFLQVFYISTTPVGEPLVRVAAPGLRYRGRARVCVFQDGVSVEIDGEDPLYFAASELRGSGSAGRRVGKAVEQGGLALMRWVATTDSDADVHAGQVLESSFRFDTRREQIRFEDVINQISPVPAQTDAETAPSQEDEK